MRGGENNPGNIRVSTSPWLGKITPQPDQTFENFDTPQDGIRALAKLLKNYYKNLKLDTIRKIITHYAPPSENLTDAYIDDVCQRCGVTPDQTLNLLDKALMGKLVAAIIHHEQGKLEYTDDQITQAVLLT